MIELYDFQITAATEMATRVSDYIEAPLFRGRGPNQRRVPFVQFLSSITASGKTIILGDAVSQVATLAPVSPVVLWISRLTVVVEQTLTNLQPGGTYNELIAGFEVRSLGQLDQASLESDPSPFLFFATTGTFNVRAKEGRKVFDTQMDRADQSIWESLKLRLDMDGQRRPLIVVYDEAHNLSDQQTRLLLDLEPDAFLLSTATTKIPAVFQEEVLVPLRTSGEFSTEDLTTTVPAADVAKSGLVKERIDLIGRQSVMEEVISEMIQEMSQTQKDAVAVGMKKPVKAVYVCRTNITEGDDRKRDDPSQPFERRQAPPILIWRHLVEGLGVDPTTIAAYCDLKVDKNHPLPHSFTLYQGGEKDYGSFIKGDYTHIIFNQSLEEGWDDPSVYFAYIDKTLGSTIAAEQIVGRLLRQPGRKHYPAERLNGAQLFIRVESNKVFDEVVDKTQARLDGDGVPVAITRTRTDESNRRSLTAKSDFFVPEVATHTAEALDEMEEIVQEVPDYTKIPGSTVGIGRRTRVQKVIGNAEKASFEWEKIGTSTKVSARWLFDRSLRRYHRAAAASIVLESSNWDALIGVGSSAAKALDQYAQRVGTTFITRSYVEVADTDDEDYVVGDCLVRAEGYTPFKNAIHEGYSGLNPSLELPFARDLDLVGFPWARNPSRTGFGIPLIKQGGNDTFYPDFLVWAHGDVYLLDTKGSHLQADAVRKLVRIKQSPGRPRLHIRFIVEGTWRADGVELDKTGYTVIGFRPDGEVSYTPATDLKTSVSSALRK